MPGVSLTSLQNVIETSGSLRACEELPFGTDPDQRGSPGAENRTCFEYSMASIPVAYDDIEDPNAGLLSLNATLLNAQVTIDTSAAPLVMFGVPYSSIKMSSNGYVAPSANAPSGSYDFESPGAPLTAPNAGTPNPSFVIFGDQIDDYESHPSYESMLYAKRFEAGESAVNPAPHWIFQWAHVEAYDSGGAWGAEDDMNFQIKAFDDGTVEFHYATMTSGTADNFASGSSASIWLENTDGSAALSLGTPTSAPVITPHSAYRFTPVAP